MEEKAFNRMMKLQMATTREEVIKILRTDPTLTEERIQRMMEIWKAPGSETAASTPNEPEKGFCELFRELLATDDLTKKEAIYEKIEEQERKRVRMEIFDRWLESKDKQEFIFLGLQLDPKATEEEMADLFDKSMTGYRQKRG